jgi:hypothetical protein
MTNSLSIQQEICCAICIWFLFVTAAMIYALWTGRESPPPRQRRSSSRGAAEASVDVRATAARKLAGVAERADSDGNRGAG